MDVGENLTSYPNLDFCEGNTLQELRDLLVSIRLPYKIIAIYPVGARHVAWISTTKKMIKIKKEVKNGSFKE